MFFIQPHPAFLAVDVRHVNKSGVKAGFELEASFHGAVAASVQDIIFELFMPAPDGLGKDVAIAAQDTVRYVVAGIHAFVCDNNDTDKIKVFADLLENGHIRFAVIGVPRKRVKFPEESVKSPIWMIGSGRCSFETPFLYFCAVKLMMTTDWIKNYAAACPRETRSFQL